MDEIEFRKRVYANPQTPDQDVLNAARDNPAYQKILEQARLLDRELQATTGGIAIPASLQDSLLDIPDQAERAAGTPGYFQYFALAASLLLAVGVSFSLLLNSGPSSADLLVANHVLQHLYAEPGEIDEITSGIAPASMPMPVINEVMSGAGTRLVSTAFMSSMPVRSARPCEIIPAYQSAHLILQGSRGAVSVIIINNTPVSVEFSIRDERFAGVVIPFGEGNMILVGEKNEDLDSYRDLFSENVDWVI